MQHEGSTSCLHAEMSSAACEQVVPISGSASSSGTQSSPTPVDQGVWQAVTGGFKEELAALKEGAVYISAPKNRSAALCTRSLAEPDFYL